MAFEINLLDNPSRREDVDRGPLAYSACEAPSQSVGGAIAELQSAEQRGADPRMGGKRQQRPVDVRRKLAARSDEPHRVLAERAIGQPAGRPKAVAAPGASAVAS